MQLRPLTPSDLPGLDEIDATIDSGHYLHIDRQQPVAEAEALPSTIFSLQDRLLRERILLPNRLSDEMRFLAKQLATGADEGLGVVAEHEGQIIASLLARPDPAHSTYELVDLRVDSDFRRQGIGLALLYQLLATARDQEQRAVRAEVLAQNYPAIQLLRKTAFELAGLDTHRLSNHDLVKEQVTLLFYAALD
ncbi:MAG TPA: GNAT family N-acetyltransferase [Tepidisphaeraceae bacterium]|jgi:ribosomal protein S18 acetylase RimI-like enzyme|nr:GNAT family N-acetyltransferase [Tepidisphaeraceae bacterium]